jgi:hypothetical protein
MNCIIAPDFSVRIEWDTLDGWLKRSRDKIVKAAIVNVSLQTFCSAVEMQFEVDADSLEYGRP